MCIVNIVERNRDIFARQRRGKNSRRLGVQQPWWEWNLCGASASGETAGKTIREKNHEDCRELSHQSLSVNRGQALGLLVRLSFILLRTST